MTKIILYQFYIHKIIYLHNKNHIKQNNTENKHQKRDKNT